jgi:hypothetical protein
MTQKMYLNQILEIRGICTFNSNVFKINIIFLAVTMNCSIILKNSAIRNLLSEDYQEYEDNA